MSSPATEAINYDSPPLVEVEIEGTDFRLDAGKQGTALCISTRPSGSWDWSFGGEARWDVGSLPLQSVRAAHARSALTRVQSGARKRGLNAQRSMRREKVDRELHGVDHAQCDQGQVYPAVELLEHHTQPLGGKQLEPDQRRGAEENNPRQHPASAS